MTRKDNEKDTDRPHYYSQFWLDVAAGRKVIGGPKVEEENEAEAETPEPTPPRKTGRGSIASVTDGYKDTSAQTMIEPGFSSEDFAEPEEEEYGLSNGVDDLEIPTILVDETLADTTVNDMDYVPEEEEEPVEEEEFFFDEEEEEEEDDSWSSRGRKKPKPGRQMKPPKPLKKPKRETRRGF